MKQKIALLLILICCLFALPACTISRKQYEARNFSEYSISAALNSDMTISGSETVKYFNKSEEALSEVVFSLPPNGFAKTAKYSAVPVEESLRAYPNGESYGKIEILTVRVGGEVVECVVGGEDNNSITVPLQVELFPKERVEIAIDFVTTLANVKHRLGYTDNAINLGNWYPVLAVYENFKYKSYPYYSTGDPFYLDCANYNVEFSCDKSLVVAHSGELIQREETGNISTYHLKEIAIRDFALVLSKDFKLLQKNVDGVNLCYYYINDTDMVASLKSAEGALREFSKSFGKYDYKNLSVVQTDFIQGGMEFSNLVYISMDVKGKTYQEVIVHEVAHQWWYLLVGNNQVEEAWLDEGLTEFSTAYYYHKNGDDRLLGSGEKGYRGYIKLYETFASPINTNMQRSLKDFSSSVEYVAMAYSKGQMLFESLYRELGEEAFIKSVKEYFNTYRHMLASKDKLIAAFSKGSNRTLEEYINGFISGRIFL